MLNEKYVNRIAKYYPPEPIDSIELRQEESDHYVREIQSSFFLGLFIGMMYTVLFYAAVRLIVFMIS